MVKILFVCTGNTCRSAMAQSIFRFQIKKDELGDRIKIFSAGLCAHEGDPMNDTAKAALKKLGYRAGTHRARLFTLDMIKKYDYIIMMTQHHARAVGNFENVRVFGEFTGGGDVGDPFGQSVEQYIRTAKEIERGFEPIIREVLK